MRLWSHTLSSQHFAKVISYPTRQTHGSQRGYRWGSLVLALKKKVKIELGVASFTCNQLDFIFVQQGKDGGKRVREREIEGVRMRFSGLIRMRVSCRIPFRSQCVYTQRRKAATEKSPRVCQAPFLSQSCRGTALTLALDAPLSSPHLPFPTLINNTCWF